MITKTEELKEVIRSMSKTDRKDWINERIELDDIFEVLNSWGESTCHSELDLILNSK